MAAAGDANSRGARVWAVAVGLFAGVELLAIGAAQPLDLDGDGLSTTAERAQRTDWRRADTDGDALPDGWEAARGLSPRDADTDADGLRDDRELDLGSDPLASDTDGDGLPDAAEDPAALARPDCDGDGVASILETDDDADRRPDGEEPPGERCNPDVDGDGVLDGDEANAACVRKPDCDDDGVEDGPERTHGFDPLNPDSYGVHLPDGVVFSFARAGQPPGADADGDGIPDPWENQTGLIDWGPFQPRAGQRDLLVEFVRVLGPDSSRFAGVSLAGAYQRVASAFDAEAIRLQWVETVVQLPAEPIPALIPTRTSTYYRDVLDRARYSANPYVLTVALNPQHNQTDVVHAGVAPIRGMLAAVDVGQYVEVDWQDAGANYSVSKVSPFLESLIRDDRLDQTSQPGGVRPDGSYYLLLSGNSGPLEVRWNPFWLKSPRLQAPNGTWLDLHETARRLLEPALARTILHEMGHTLGLCHTHDAECQKLLPADQVARQAESSMSYQSGSSTIQFLAAEWERVRDYLSCPPPSPVRLVAENASRDARLDAKYEYSLERIENVSLRTCKSFVRVPAEFAPVANGSRYASAASLQDSPRVTNAPTVPNAYVGSVVALGAAAAGVFLMRARPGRRSP